MCIVLLLTTLLFVFVSFSKLLHILKSTSIRHKSDIFVLDQFLFEIDLMFAVRIVVSVISISGFIILAVAVEFSALAIIGQPHTHLFHTYDLHSEVERQYNPWVIPNDPSVVCGPGQIHVIAYFILNGLCLYE